MDVEKNAQINSQNSVNNENQGNVYYSPPQQNSGMNNAQYVEVKGSAVNNNSQSTCSVSDNENTSNDGLSITSLVCGILSLFFVLLAVPGLVTGYLYKNKSITSTQGRKYAKAGIICSWISFGIYILLYILLLICFLFPLFHDEVIF